MIDGLADAIIFRPHTVEDLAFVRDSWGKSAFKGNNLHKILSPDEFHAFHRPIRERFFEKPNTAVIVACNPEDHWQVIGWIAVEKIPSGLILHFIYVKSLYKGQGIAKELIRRAIPTKPIFYSHLTKHAAEIISKKHEQFAGWRHVPHLV